MILGDECHKPSDWNRGQAPGLPQPDPDAIAADLRITPEQLSDVCVDFDAPLLEVGGLGRFLKTRVTVQDPTIHENFHLQSLPADSSLELKVI